MKYKKGITPVIASSLLILVTIISLISYQSWFNSYQGELEKNILSSENEISISNLLNDTLYLHSNGENNLLEVKIYNSNGTKCHYQEDLVYSLAGEWSFDERNSTHIYDTSINQNHGLINNSVVFNSGVISSGAEFNGINTSIIIPHSTEIDPGFESFTVGSWVKSNQSGFNNWYINKRLSGYGLSRNAGGYAIQYQDSNSIRAIQSISDEYSNEWQFIYYVADRNLNRSYFYANGIFRDSSFFNQSFSFSTTKDLLFGTYFQSFFSSSFFNGSIDEVKYFNGTLSKQQLDNLYYFDTLSELTVEDGLNELNIARCDLSTKGIYTVVIRTDSEIVVKKFFH